MRGLLVAAGAVLLFTAPAFAQTSTTIIEKKTTTTEMPAPSAGSTVSTTIIAPTPPPAPRVEVQPPPPGPRMVWVPGHWGWERDQYVWLGGKYMEPPREHAACTAVRWMHRRRRCGFPAGRRRGRRVRIAGAARAAMPARRRGFTRICATG